METGKNKKIIKIVITVLKSDKIIWIYISELLWNMCDSYKFSYI